MVTVIVNEPTLVHAAIVACGLLEVLSVYVSPVVAVTDLMFEPVQKELDTGRWTVTSATVVEDDAMMFGRGLLTTYESERVEP